MEKDPQRDMLKLIAYGTLANFWINLAGSEEVLEKEAKTYLALQESLQKEFESTLRSHLDETSMISFREYVNRFKVRASEIK
jgi:hypothetical protein